MQRGFTGFMNGGMLVEAGGGAPHASVRLCFWAGGRRRVLAGFPCGWRCCLRLYDSALCASKWSCLHAQ